MNMDFAEMAAAARSAEGRAALADQNVIPELLSHLQASIDSGEENLLLLRLLRNLCAGEARNQAAFCENRGLEILANLADLIVKQRQAVTELDENHTCGLDSAKVLLQLMGNVAGGGHAAPGLIWSTFFPDAFVNLACVSVAEVLEPLCMVLYTCAIENGLWGQLSQGKGARLMAMLLRDASGETKNHWLGLIVEELCFVEELFQPFFTNLGPSGGSFSSEQVVLLDMMNAVVEKSGPPVATYMQPASVMFLAELIERAATTVVTSGATPLPMVPTGTPVVDVLGFSLLLVRSLCANSDGCKPGNRPSDVLAKSKLVERCLDMLRALGPPEMVRKTTMKQVNDGNAVEEQLSMMKVSDENPYPRRDPYRGYRRDVVAVVANMSFKNLKVQDLVRVCGGLLLMLQQCVVEEGNPYLREWGLWAIRNLTEGNEENVREIANLEMKRPVDTEEIRKVGFKVDINSATGRPRLVNLDSTEC